jgi:hypothetical protein
MKEYKMFKKLQRLAKKDKEDNGNNNNNNNGSPITPTKQIGLKNTSKLTLAPRKKNSASSKKKHLVFADSVQINLNPLFSGAHFLKCHSCNSVIELNIRIGVPKENK